MKKSIKLGLGLVGFLFLSTGCSVNYCSETDLANIKAMYELKTSIYVVDQVISYANEKEVNLTVESSDLYSYVLNADYVKYVEDKLTNNATDASNKIKGYLNSTAHL